MRLPARIVRVDQPVRGVLALGLSIPGERAALLVSARPGAAGVGLVRERPRGAPADPFTSLLRRAIVGAELHAIRRRGAALTLSLHGAGGSLALWIAPLGRSGAIALVDETGRPKLGAGPAIDTAPEGESVDPEALWGEGERLAASLEGAGEAARRDALDKALRRAKKQLERKLAAIEADAARATSAPDLRADATALLSNLHAIAKDADFVEALDYTVDPPAPRRVQLDRRLGPKAQAEALFKKARRLERGAKIAGERWTACAAELEALEALAASLAEASTEAQLDAIEARAIPLGLRAPGEAASPRARPAERRPFRTFHSADGLAIHVGRSAEDNDRLTLGHARPHHLWLHARGTSGSHVVVALDRGQSCPPATLADAATLAAHFSRFRADPEVEVQHTPRRYVHKRRGAAPGSVTVEREKVIVISMEADRLARLLATERR
jgi:predicted ribosome quality control (RQC) complex YloA/Tae2 family protein